ncbi:HNH endonuclease [Pararhizobium sp.]|uniref:HNH endonuclease n=1 Tax=Pararhizobium sp. TaxID=1977563 RepID=UPI003D0E40FE
MQLSEYDYGKYETHPKISSPGKCIYCYRVFPPEKLTDEHVIPYALGANTMIFLKSCCEECQGKINPYEQSVLKHQLGVFRAQVEAPSRNKKDRPTDANIQFFEVDESMTLVRDLGHRIIPLADAPLMFNLWQSPPPRILEETVIRPSKPWTFVEKEVAVPLCRKIADETGSLHVAMKVGDVNRLNYLRSLAKTAHAFTAAKVGLDAFEPCLSDIILNRSDDVDMYVGDIPGIGPFETHLAQTMQISLGGIPDGPAEGYMVVRIQLYPSLGSPEHLIVVGRPLKDIAALFPDPAEISPTATD